MNHGSDNVVSSLTSYVASVTAAQPEVSVAALQHQTHP